MKLSNDDLSFVSGFHVYDVNIFEARNYASFEKKVLSMINKYLKT